VNPLPKFRQGRGFQNSLATFVGNMQKTPTGSIALFWSQPVHGDRPVVVFIHGALRSAGVLAHWADILKDVADTVLLDLPGHGHSHSLTPATVETMAASVHEAICAALSDRHVLLVGESLGGLVALAVGGKAGEGPIRGILAADPPLTTAKLWHVAANFRSASSRTPDNTFLNSLSHEVFGVSGDATYERIYYPLIGNLRVPTIIATGDVPLFPPRTLNGVACVFDEVDQFVVEHLYPGRARIHLVQNCGHLLLVDAEDQCRELIATWLLHQASWEMGLTGLVR